ncbi:family 78 glycoside hydrolase catalytic domain [Kiritimatiella glycovorans]|uniref:alpha-L-rhamnosidase n=1 Tax=Kiritimatiella glycovorans TaxID=1307763 RepID=A0A0G3EE13_9BACT|nr:family 78 glycoside hydrolase catalytic domain [Kiritimatiella glycovorans]AKJ63657.1 Alpha-L-rhamnosidase [Kiritimatiella glycovorans]
MVCIAGASGELTDLTCEYLTHPLAIETDRPRLSWKIRDDRRGAAQTAYEIIAASTREKLDRGEGDLWSTGKVESDRSLLVVYTGDPAPEGGRIWWKARYWDQEGEVSAWSDPAWWETGLPYPDAWEAEWIAVNPMLPVVDEVTDTWFNYGFVGQEIAAARGDPKYIKGSAEPADPKLWLDHLSKPAPQFRRTFRLESPPREARAYICGLGYYELFINGRRVGDRVLDPAYQNYEKQAFYVAYDVTPFLREGNNTIGVRLGDGQYNQVGMSWFYFGRGFLTHGDPCMIFQLEGKLENGRSIKVVSDRRWRATQSGALLRNQFYIGEVRDARRRNEGWTTAEYDDRRWTYAREIPEPVPHLVPMLAPPEREIRTIEPVDILEPVPGIYVVDFGEAFCGKTRLKVRAPQGTKIVQRPAHHIRNHPQFFAGENTLNPDGTFDSARYFLGGTGGLPYEDPELHGNVALTNMIMLTPVSRYGKSWYFKNVSVYTASDADVDVFENEFLYSGFRYVELIGLPEKPALEDIEGVVVHTDAPQTGRVRTDHQRLNTLYDMFARTLDYTVHGTLQDNCDAEKSAWKFDLNVGDFYSYYRNSPQFWAKYLRDIQLNTVRGIPANISPTVFKSYSIGHPLHHYFDYGSHTVTAAFRQYLFNRDRRMLERHFPYIKEWIDVCYPYVMRDEDISPRALGDWLDAWKGPGGRPGSKGYGSMNTSRDFIARAFFYRAMDLAERCARVLGETTYADDLAERRRPLKALINRRHFQTRENPEAVPMVRGPGETIIPRDPAERNSYGSQAADLLAVRYGIVPEGREPEVMENVVRDIQEEWDGHLSVGWHGIPVICTELSRWGYGEVAMQLFNNDTYPSWGYFLKHGFTTTPEGWSAGAPDTLPTTRVIQSEKNSAGVWFYDTLGGILPDFDSPGFKHFTLRPIPAPDVDEADVSFESLYGTIRSAWRRSAHSITLEASVPPNTTAELYLPVSSRKVRIDEGGTPLVAGGVPEREIGGMTFRGFIETPAGLYAHFHAAAGSYVLTAERSPKRS